MRPNRSLSGLALALFLVVHTSRHCVTVVVPKSTSTSDVNAVSAQAAATASQCQATGFPPPGYFVVGDGPVTGPKQ